ncbi:MAG: hypothetical protein V3V15_06145 [Sphingorhabdus sp.]
MHERRCHALHCCLSAAIVNPAKILIAAFALILSACGGDIAEDGNTERDSSKTKVILIGAIHQGHVGSKRYGLDVLKRAIRKAKPDQIFTEIPPDRLDAAIEDFHKSGKVTEPRVDDFPEYRDMLFPLTREMDFEIVPVAAWSREMADSRAEALEQIQHDPARAAQWAEYRAAHKAFDEALSGRGDDPAFIHSGAYDALVRKAQTPYQQYFDEDLGPGGWTQINAAHYALIGAALDKTSGQGRTVVIIFGAWHKYMFLKELRKRGDIELVDPVPLLTGG